MRRSRTPKPGQRGTEELPARHGAGLLSVRLRHGEDAREHLKTVELVVRRRPGSRSLGGRAAVAAGRSVALRVGLREPDLQRRVKSLTNWGYMLFEGMACHRMQMIQR